ncbi:MAG: SPOR domain-containing protein, partial [Balneolaceae bacterium]
ESAADDADDIVSEGQPPIEQETEAITPPEPEPAGEVYGLMGDLIPEANDGYTIVLHSLRSLASAREAAADLRDSNYRTIVTERVVNDQTVYRVGVGQFPSIDEALSMARTLPVPYNDQHFIQRIQ